MTIDGLCPAQDSPRQLQIVRDPNSKPDHPWVVVSIITAGTPYQAVRVPLFELLKVAIDAGALQE